MHKNSPCRCRTLLVRAAALLLALTFASAFADTVYLRDGGSISGNILATKPDFIVLDLGYTVLEVPQKQIEKIEKGEKAETAPQVEETVKVDEKLLYRKAKLKVRPVKELVAEFGEGVGLVQTPKGMGSGFIINEDGYLITNAHVIQGETNLSVTLFIKDKGSFSRQKITDVKIVAVNAFVDLALLKFDPPKGIKLTPLYLSDIDDLRTGDAVFAIGNPLGFDRSVSEGIVSTKSRAAGGLVLIQTTAPINPGNSGGPLLNMRGEVVGVTNMKIAFIAEGMGFAVPVNFVDDFLKFREAFSYDKDNPNTGYHYLSPPHKAEPEKGNADAAKDEK